MAGQHGAGQRPKALSAAAGADEDDREGGAASRYLRRLRELIPESDGLTVGDFVSGDGRVGTAFTILLLSIPTIIPTPGPFGLIFGTCLMAIAVQILLGTERLRLPGFLARRKLSRRFAARAVDGALPFVARVESWLDPNRLHWLTGAKARRLLGLPILFLAFIIALPIPFGNSLPALALCLIAVALMERDGLVVILSMVMAVAAAVAAYYLAQFAGSALASYWPF